jgi:MFS family permease
VPTSIRLRLFLTCWLVYVAHFATDVVREHYLVLSIVDDHSYLLDKYYGLHVDIFRNPPAAKVQGAHHGANPGISMVAAVPYLVTRPAVDWVVTRELASRSRGDTTATYQDNRPRRVEFYQKIRRLGWDIRFGLVSAITTTFCMAPIAAASVVLMFSILGTLGLGQRGSLALSLLYAFGTPVFFRAAYLNQNLGLGIFAFAAFALVWNPRTLVRWRERTRFVCAGLLGGLAFLCDYSGAILMGFLGFYAWWRASDDWGVAGGFKSSLWYLAGALPGILLLWQYQWASFGHPFQPPQHWMAPVEFIDVGYKGVGGLSPELLRMLLVDPRFGLLIAMPVAALAAFAPWLARRGRSPVPAREALVCLGLSVALILFFSTVQYTRLQWVTGIRYLAPLFPFLFLAAVPALLRLPKLLTYGIAFLSIVINWSMAMVRSQDGIVDNVKRVLIEGFQLPWLTVLGKLSAQYASWLTGTVSALPILVLSGVTIWMIWRIRTPWRRLDPGV